MQKNYFVVERSGKSIDNMVIRRNNDDTVMFEDLMSMSYEEMKSYKDMDLFLDCIMDATNNFFHEGDDQTLVTLIGSDDVFIWGILVGPGEKEGSLKYAFIDWGKDGKKYRYQKS
jgi:hypothetical protein